jgi:hypothetical protein
MKSRLGFVSNSSSSSFVIIVKKDAYERRLKEVHPYVKAVIEAMHDKKEATFLGEKVVILGTWMDAGGGSNLSSDYLDIEFDGEIPTNNWGDSMDPYSAFHEEFATFKDEDCAYMSLMDG